MTQAGGTIFAIVLWLLSGFVLLAILYGLSRFLGRERNPRPDPMHQPFGDYPNVSGFTHSGGDTL